MLFLLASGVAIAGWLVVVAASRRIPVETATVDGIQVHVDDARWILDQMDHGENYNRPGLLMPDMPAHGSQRVTLELRFTNQSAENQILDAQELELVPEVGDSVPPVSAEVGKALIAPGQAFNTVVQFDFDTRRPHGKLQVAWRHDGSSTYFAIPEPPAHEHLRPHAGEVALPQDVRLVLPLGRPESGKQLFTDVYGCSACHGDVHVPGSNNVGPFLGSIGRTAEKRVPGVSGAQYIYDSIIHPGAYIAPVCAHGQACNAPSAMPEYAALVNLQDLADLVSFLLQQKGAEGSEAPAMASRIAAPPREEKPVGT